MNLKATRKGYTVEFSWRKEDGEMLQLYQNLKLNYLKSRGRRSAWQSFPISPPIDSLAISLGTSKAIDTGDLMTERGRQDSHLRP